MYTIHDVAKAAGVSITTVSRALNGHSDVNEKTRQRIARIAKELGYRPSAAARNLRSKRTDTIAFAPWIPKYVDPNRFFKEFIGMLALDCFQHNLSLLATLPYSEEDEVEMYQALATTGRVDGIILASVQPQDMRIPLLQKIGIPFVSFGRILNENDLSYPFVDVDGKAGVYKLVEHLCINGHRRIAYLSGRPEASFFYYRKNGYLEALRKHAIEEDPRLITIGLDAQEETIQAIEQMMRLPAECVPTAIVTSSIQLALYILPTLREMGWSIGKNPGQIAIASFDDRFAAYLDPPLTTTYQPMEEQSRLMLELLVSIINQRELRLTTEAYPHMKRLGEQQFLLEPDLVVRASA